MNFRQAKARQPEILRSIQKDASYTTELAEDLSDALRITGSRHWIRYNQMCKLIAQLSYHGFTSFNNLQTLGEEYTGIIQVNGNYTQVPSRLLQLTALVLEFGGESLYLHVLQKLDDYIEAHDELLPKAKQRLRQCVFLLRCSPSYVIALHKSFFYLRSGKYQISKRLTDINYVLVRHWLQSELSLYGYKLLGAITFLQVGLSVMINGLEAWKQLQQKCLETAKKSSCNTFRLADITAAETPQCLLCMEPRSYTTATPCGHLFCWQCLLDWLDEREECPYCRETVRKSQVIQLQNYL